MSLEGKVVSWVDLGVMPYQEAYKLQEELVKLRRDNIIGDVILAVQHPLEVSFGSDRTNNTFSDLLLSKVKDIYGEDFTHEDVVKYLGMEHNAGFSQMSRGGGATVIAPGQFVYYPIVLHANITGKALDVANYKTRIYSAMFDSLQALGVNDLNVGSDKSYQNRRERRDVWVQKDGKSLKMGSKGIRFSGKVAHHGFVLYAQEEGIKNFWMVNPCGYTPDEVTIVSIENFLGRSIDSSEVHSAVRSAIKLNFGYDGINDLSVEELRRKIEILPEVRNGRN